MKTIDELRRDMEASRVAVDAIVGSMRTAMNAKNEAEDAYAKALVTEAIADAEKRKK